MVFMQLLKNAFAASEVVGEMNLYTISETRMEGSLYAPTVLLLGIYPREMIVHHSQ